jgi:hypothetical protein
MVVERKRPPTSLLGPAECSSLIASQQVT